MKKLLTLAVLSLIFAATSTAQQSSPSVPLPQDMNIIKPDSALDPDIKAFSGKWEGIWDNELPGILVVEKITPPDVFVIYAFGSGTGSSSRLQPSWRRFQGVIEPGRIKLTLVTAYATYTLQPDGTLKATHERPGGGRISNATMRRID
jgi:hypothetical protein